MSKTSRLRTIFFFIAAAMLAAGLSGAAEAAVSAPVLGRVSIARADATQVHWVYRHHHRYWVRDHDHR